MPDPLNSPALSWRQRDYLVKGRAAKRRAETLANPFRRKRRANGETRYLNRREEREHITLYDRAGNPTV